MIRNRPIFHPTNARHHGSVYIAILGVSLIVVTLAVGGILASRVQARSSAGGNDMAQAQLCAQAGLNLARLWINQDSNWRTNRTNGNWTSALAVGGGTVSIDVVDPIDGNLANRPHDPVSITATAQFGQARRILTQTVVASPVALPALQYAIHGGGQIHVRSGKTLSIGTATASTNASLQIDGVIEGNASVTSAAGGGIVFGALTNGAAAKTLPPSTLAESYASLGTLIVPPNTLNKVVLSSASNPWGSPDPDGVYVIRPNADITIKNTRVLGTLVIINPGKKVTIDGSVLFQPARTDYPSLIVNGNVVLQFITAGGLSEAILSTNFNPPGTPYQGLADTDMLDTFPSEIQGLVHITGTLVVSQPCTIRGAVICEGTGNNAVDINASPFKIVYDPTLFTSPPQFYTTSVPMTSQPGSTKQVVN